MLWYTTLALVCLQGAVYTSESESFLSHVLRNLKDDILHLKPGSNKTYILNHKLLGRNDSIELDIKSRIKGENRHDKEVEEMFDDKKLNHKHKKRVLSERKHRSNKVRKAMMREFEDIKDRHAEKIRQIMKHKTHEGERKKIRIKVIRKHKVNGHKENDEQPTHNATTAAKAKDVNIVKKYRIFHKLKPIKRRAKVHRKRIAANGEEPYENDEDDSAFGEGGQIPELFLGDDYDVEEISALFKNTKDQVILQFSSTTPSTTPSTTTEATTPNIKDEYTYEYVYEDEVDKGKGTPKKSKHGSGDKKHNGVTSDEYTYEYIYEDEMKKSKATVPTTSTTQATTIHQTSAVEHTEEFCSRSHEEMVTGSGLKEGVKLSPSIEREIQLLQEREHNHTLPTHDPEEYYGDSNSAYVEPERFKCDYDPDDEMNDPAYSLEYDWAAPAKTTTAVKHLVAASSIMYDDENTEEFLAQRNETKRQRGYDSHPRDMFFTIDLKDLKPRYTRPIPTPEDYEEFESPELWNAKDKHIGDHDENHNQTTFKPFMNTNTFNVTKRLAFVHNMTVNDKMEFNFDVEKLMQNSTHRWMRNITQSTTQDVGAENDDVFVTMDEHNLYHLPEYKPYKKWRRHKRDIGGGMKMPRRQYEMLLYLFQKVNNTRWVAKLKKLRNAPNIMECLIRRDKKKTNKKSNAYKLKAIKPKKRPKGPKRVVLKKRKPKEDRRALRVKLAAKRRRQKQAKGRKRRSVDTVLDTDNRYVDIEAIDMETDINKEEARRFRRDLGLDDGKLVRKKRKVVDKVSNDLLHDFEMDPNMMAGTASNMTEVFQANLLETHKMALDKAITMAIDKFQTGKNTTDFNNKTEEIKVYRTFICEYKQLMEEWFVSTFFDVPNAMRRYAKKHIFKMTKDRVPTNAQLNQYFEYENYLTIRLELAEKVIRKTIKHFYDELEDKVFGYFYGFDKVQKCFEDPNIKENRTTLSDRDLLRLLVVTTEYDPDLKMKELREARERLKPKTDRWGSTLEPTPDVRWK